MKTLSITAYKSTKLYSPFNNVISNIELPDKPFGSGAFGDVYKCRINNSEQAVKVFKKEENRSYQTICELQDAVIKYNEELNREGKKVIEKINALYALPLFSFKGHLGGMEVMGYSAHLLGKQWESFNVMFSEETPENIREQKHKYFYVNGLTTEMRLKFVFDLLEGFNVLQSMRFIYADLNPQNFFINITEGKLCLIDYDSGGVNKEPETIGKQGDWMAPEINFEERTTANLFTDYWSIAMAIHYFFNPCPPFFYIKGHSKKLMQQYFSKYQYFDINTNDRNFNNIFLKQYLDYKDDLNNNVPPEIVKAFKQSFQNGYFNSGARVTSKQWFVLIEPLVPNVYQPLILITAISNNTNFGTVNVSGNVIIATPNPYYRISSPAYEITNGNAKVIKSGNTFTVTASTDCEIRINFEKTKIPPQPPNITAIPNNSTLGTVYVSGYGIIAIPKNNKVRFAKCSYTIINGKASVVQNGNTFTVTASTDCEIRINFEEEKTICDKKWRYISLVAVVALCLSIGTFIIFFKGTEKGCNGIENGISSIDSLMLIGDYTAKYKIDGQSSGDIMNGYIEAISQNEYRITIYSDFDPVCFSFFYDGKTGTISLSDFPETELNQIHYGNYCQIQIIFKKDNQLWEFTKELAE